MNQFLLNRSSINAIQILSLTSVTMQRKYCVFFCIVTYIQLKLGSIHWFLTGWFST